MDAAERAAAGKAARSAARRSSHAAWEPPESRADPVEILERPGAVAGSRAGADPLRADVGLALRLLPRRRRGDGRRPRRHAGTPGCGCRPAATPTSPTSAPSRRPTAASSSTSTTSTSPCPGPGSGTSSGSPPASRSPAAKTASSARSAARRCCEAARAYREAMRTFASQRNLDVWYARLDVESVMGEVEAEPKLTQPGAQGRGQGAGQGQPAGAREAHPNGRRRAAHPQRTAADRPRPRS